MKISIIGAGKVGSTAAYYIVQNDLADVVLYDIQEGLPQGIALDINEASPVSKFDKHIEGTNKISDIKDSDIVIITAGFPRKPGMDRLDLLKKNQQIIEAVSKDIKKFASRAIIIVVTNPLDIMVYAALKVTGFDKKKIIGMAGVLDTSRMRYFISKELNVSAKDISAIVLGSHGDEMVPLIKYTTVSGVNVTKLLSKEKLAEIIQHTQKAGGEIVSYLKTGSAYHAPAASVVEMVESIVHDKKKQLPCCAYLNGEYGLKDICIGVPCILGKNGIEKIVELDLDKEELEKFQRAAKVIREGISHL